MFADPETFWLTVTNLALGIVALAFCLAVAYVILQEGLSRVLSSRRKAQVFIDTLRRTHRLQGTLACGGACGPEAAGSGH